MNQLVKMRLFFGAAVDLEALAEEMILRDFRYSVRLQLWSEAIGRENIKVIALEEGEDFAKAFFNTLGLDNHMFPNAPPRDSTNKSLRLGSLQLIQWIFRRNVALDHSRRVVLNRRFHEHSDFEMPNLLNQDTRDHISSQRLQVIEDLSKEWLGGKRCFQTEPELPVYGDFGKLDCPGIEELAEQVLNDDPRLLWRLREEL